MKVVLFCGGQGMRLRGHAGEVPKPLVEVGQRPILWHLMKYYAHFGHKDFIICLGYGGRQIKEFFLNYSECEMNDFVYSEGGRSIELLGTDIDDWKITFVDTGQTSNVGERLRRVRPHLEGEEMFLANYADGLSDLDLDSYIAGFAATDNTACFTTVHAPSSFHNVRIDASGNVEAIEEIARSSVRINAGFFAFRQGIFDVLNRNEELILKPFDRLIKQRRLMAVPYDGYWQPMDTFKDKSELDALIEQGSPPWQIWKKGCPDCP